MGHDAGRRRGRDLRAQFRLPRGVCGPAEDPAAQERLDRIVALGASIGRLKHALQVRGLATSPAARMTVDPPDPGVAAAIEAEVAAAAGRDS